MRAILRSHLVSCKLDGNSVGSLRGTSSSGRPASKTSTSEGEYEVASVSASASEPTSDLRLQLKAKLAVSQVAPEELRALLKDAIVEASDDRDVEPSSSDEE